jgi:hypothetical protein
MEKSSAKTGVAYLDASDRVQITTTLSQLDRLRSADVILPGSFGV